jgi:hypothetical protein
MRESELGGRKGPDRPAEQARGEPVGESTRREAGPDQSSARYEHAEAALGGADAVEKTTYVVGEGTEPDRRARGPYVARGASTGGVNLVVWVVVGIAVLIALVYVAGLFR